MNSHVTRSVFAVLAGVLALQVMAASTVSQRFISAEGGESTRDRGEKK